ncbi:protein phosphatase 2C domain-containing protein [Actinoplanes sp. NEAU-A12]|uniref:Protein phosphatase 2C domain-containing protein n=1 Tax=Actinoplanes sandaracinus TaxID=3045177 RepID=A0ABT6WYD9_9ACTN|nr:protein phosphatase 2C domain-containing protein [Actinoplanes sandaracinus]MDI6104631.1 protein phosphatase 2C domain-containing protein [Actinoplanes sandaracinus]
MSSLIRLALGLTMVVAALLLLGLVIYVAARRSGAAEGRGQRFVPLFKQRKPRHLGKSRVPAPVPGPTRGVYGSQSRGSADYRRSEAPPMQPGYSPPHTRLLDDPPPGPEGPPPGHQRRTSPPAPVPPEAAPSSPAPATTAPPAAVSPVEFAADAHEVRAPRFVAGSKASRMPWLLPTESASPPGVAADQGVLGDLEVRAASVVGSGHRCGDPVKPRQDAYRVARDRAGDHLVLAVADGMSDSLRSELGASVAVGTAVALLRRYLDDNRPLSGLRADDLFRDVAGALVQAAKDRGLDPHDVRTTLAVAVLPTRCRPDRPVEGWVAQIADTHLWRREPGSWKCLTGAEKDSFDGSVLNSFLPHVPQAARGTLFTLAWGDTVAVLSDGVSDAFSYVPGATSWFADRWRDPPPLASFLLDVDYEAKQMHDDRTAVVVWAGGSETSRGAPRR